MEYGILVKVKTAIIIVSAGYLGDAGNDPGID